MATVIVRGGLVVTEGGMIRADIVARDGIIVALTSDASEQAHDADETIDATGLIVLPGGIDAHTHMREPSTRDREGFASGTAAAAAGGITTIVEMPQADPPVTDAASFALKRAGIEANALIDVALYGGVIGQDMAQLREQAEAGAVAFKAFMCGSSAEYPAVDDAQLYDALVAVTALDSFLTVHAENDALLQAGLRRLREAGRHDPLAHCESRPPMVEVAAVRTATYLAGQANAHVHIAHVSAAGSLVAIAEARAAGGWVTAETCPQYLLLSEDDVAAHGPWARCAPAIRTQDHIEALWARAGRGVTRLRLLRPRALLDRGEGSGARFDLGRAARAEHGAVHEPGCAERGDPHLGLPARTLRRDHRHERRAHLRPLPTQGGDPDRRGCRPRPLRPDE